MAADEEGAGDVDGLGKANEPIVAARMQLLKEQQQNFHQFTNLKIIKADDGPAKPKRRKLAPPKKPAAADEQESKVYSQDFRTLKILPADTKDFNEIELIGEDLYFGNKVQDTDDFLVESNALATEDTLLDNYALKGRTISPDLELEIEKEIDDLIENDILELHENLTKAHLDRRTTTTTEEDLRQLDNLVIESSTVGSSRSTVADVVNRGTPLLGAEEDDEEYSSRIADELDEDDEDEDYYYDVDEYDIFNRNKGPRRYKR